MLTTELVITIPGHPAPKGSLKCIGGSGGRGHVLIEDNKRTKEWRLTIATWVKRKWHLQRSAKGQPIGAELTFTLPRPKGHYGTGRNQYRLKATADPAPTSHSTGDLDKLIRLALDALQDAGAIPDDCNVTEITARKSFPHDTGATPLSDVLAYPGIVIRLYPADVP